jgi:hypothetical protein
VHWSEINGTFCHNLTANDTKMHLTKIVSEHLKKFHLDNNCYFIVKIKDVFIKHIGKGEFASTSPFLQGHNRRNGMALTKMDQIDIVQIFSLHSSFQFRRLSLSFGPQVQSDLRRSGERNSSIFVALRCIVHTCMPTLIDQRIGLIIIHMP